MGEIENSVEGTLILAAFNNALDIFKKQLALNNDEYDNSSEIIECIIERIVKILEMSKDYVFSAKDYKNYWEETYNSITKYIFKLENGEVLSENQLGDLLFLLDKVVEFLLGYGHIKYLKNIKNQIDVMSSDIEKNYKKVEVDVDRYMRLRSIADSSQTESIYHNAVKNYRDSEQEYRKYFYWSLGLTVGISLLGLFVKKWLVENYLGDIEFWVLKFSILAGGITLITYFLKQSAHYQRLADQSHQTQVELQAFPSFMERIPTEEAASVRKELALKYFGREIDGAAHKDVSNLISDQMKSTTEMVKAATDVLKVKGGN